MYNIWSLLLSEEGQTLESMQYAFENSIRRARSYLIKLGDIVVDNLQKNREKVVLQRIIAVIVAIVTIFSAHLAFAYTETMVGLVYAGLDNNFSTSPAVAEEGANQDNRGYLIANSAVKASSLIPSKKNNTTASSVKATSSAPVAYSVQGASSRFASVPISAYSSTHDQTDATPFTTASGTRVRDGIVAANFLPIGTKIRIPDYYGNKVFVVEDRMNARYWKKVDIWMPTRGEALQWGVRYATIEVIN
ncbi:MAG: hypothetical protein R3346_01415 [Candidatus Spechtbacterales bacterium]|nr:hypothetical protein [Candidatus Spechtbacterales bacterium]